MSDPEGMEQADLLIGGEPLWLEGFNEMSLTTDFVFISSRSGVEYRDMGRVKGLGNVTALPTSGWKAAVSLQPGHGYLLRRPVKDEYCYARMYVAKYLTDESGALTGVRINYQSPFQHPIELEQTEFVFPGDGISKVRLLLKHPTYLQVASAPDWCEVTYDLESVTLRVLENCTAQTYKGEVLLSNSEGELTLHVTKKASAQPAFDGGWGTLEDPYRIKTAYQLDQVRHWGCRRIKTYFSLENDIDLTDYLADTPMGWTPIGTSTEPFWGTFSGNGHTLSGLWMLRPGERYVGFWGFVERSMITGLCLELGDKGMYIYSGGGICGCSVGEILISQCSVKGNIKGTDVSGILYDAVSGQVLREQIVISECYTDGYITGGRVDGIFGGNYNYPVARIENCYSTAVFNVKDAVVRHGFLESYGIAYAGNCINCYVASASNPDKTIDERCGYINHEGFQDLIICKSSYFDVDLMYSLFDLEDLQTKLEYHLTRRKQGALTTEQMKQKSSYEGWDFENIWQIEEGVSYPTLRCFNK